ncbi:MAG: cyanophycinase [Arenimonas sp.]
MSPSRISPGHSRGWIIPIGGGEHKENNPRILQRFVELCGGADADIAVIATASRMADTGARYQGIFHRLGAGRVEAIEFDARADTEDQDKLERLGDATGIFFTGGNQLSLSTILGGTPVARLLRARNAGGVHVAGTSAGAAFICEHMIAFGEDGPSPVAGSARLAPGLGLTNKVIIDQHFRERDRIGRLLTALAYNPFAIGIGLDEDTAAFIRPDEVLEVEGSGGITLVDASGIEFSSMDMVDEGEPVCMLGIRLHLLVAGASYDIANRRASAGALARTGKLTA